MRRKRELPVVTSLFALGILLATACGGSNGSSSPVTWLPTGEQPYLIVTKVPERFSVMTRSDTEIPGLTLRDEFRLAIIRLTAADPDGHDDRIELGGRKVSVPIGEIGSEATYVVEFSLDDHYRVIIWSKEISADEIEEIVSGIRPATRQEYMDWTREVLGH